MLSRGEHFFFKEEVELPVFLLKLGQVHIQNPVIAFGELQRKSNDFFVLRNDDFGMKAEVGQEGSKFPKHLLDCSGVTATKVVWFECGEVDQVLAVGADVPDNEETVVEAMFVVWVEEGEDVTV